MSFHAIAVGLIWFLVPEMIIVTVATHGRSLLDLATFWGHMISGFAVLFLFLNIIAFDFLLKHGQLYAFFSHFLPGRFLDTAY
ncbi:hypothetical protein BKA80DRAFT_306677 [Phyllosticta citrichinensis]